jgi:hypothetical protein
MSRRRDSNVSVKPLIAFVLAGVVGGALGTLLAVVNLRPPPFLDTNPATVAAPLLVAAVSMAAGVLAGWFLAILVLWWTPGRLHCPRCGTANRRGVHECQACLLRLS